MLYVTAGIVGLIVGSAYSFMGVTVTLMYRSTGVLSFAHAAFAMVAAYIYADLGEKGWPIWLAALVALVVAVVYGLLVEQLVIRRVRAANATMKMIATLGVLQFTTAAIVLVYGSDFGKPAQSLLPDRNISIGDVQVSYQQLAVLVVAIAMSGALALFLGRTRFGLAIRAVPQSPETARLMGVSLVDVSRFNWALGALLAALTGVLVTPTMLFNIGTFPLLLLKALTACLFGGLVSLPLTFAGGLVVGLVESEILVRSSSVGAGNLGVLGIIVVLLLVRKRWAAEIPPETVFPATPLAVTRTLRRGGRAISTAASQVLRPYLPAFAALALVGAVIIPARSEYWGFIGVRALFYAIQALSLVLLVGYAGQVSLMHGAYVGIGSFTTSYLSYSQGWPLELSIPVAALAGVVMGGLVGLPALRLSGLQFAIASLGFAGAAAGWLFQQPDFSRQLPRGTLFGVDLFDTGNLYLFMLPVTIVLYLLVWNVRRSTYGALVIASRESPLTVGHFGADPNRTRMSSFLLASFIAALGGSFWGIALTRFSADMFSFGLSISLLLFTVLAGIGSLAAPLLVALLFGVLPSLLQGESGAEASAWPDLIGGLVVIGLITSRPQGIASLFGRVAKKPAAVAAGEELADSELIAVGRFDAVVHAGAGRRRRAAGAVPPPAVVQTATGGVEP